MQIVLNGEPREVDDRLSIAALLTLLDVRTKGVAVERNLEVVPRSQHADTSLVEGDRVEVVTLVGGG